MRNIFCKHYSKCLDRSIAEDLLFDCKGCTHYEKSENPDSDIFGCYLLVLAIFSLRHIKLIERPRKPETWPFLPSLRGLYQSFLLIYSYGEHGFFVIVDSLRHIGPYNGF